MDRACELVKLPWLYRKALLVLNQLEVIFTALRPAETTVRETPFHDGHPLTLRPLTQVEDNDEHIKTTIKAGGLMDVVESYPWNGEEVSHKRRDKRKGHHTGKAVRLKEGPSVQ